MYSCRAGSVLAPWFAGQLPCLPCSDGVVRNREHGYVHAVCHMHPKWHEPRSYRIHTILFAIEKEEDSVWYTVIAFLFLCKHKFNTGVTLSA